MICTLSATPCAQFVRAGKKPNGFAITTESHVQARGGGGVVIRIVGTGQGETQLIPCLLRLIGVEQPRAFGEQPVATRHDAQRA